MGKKILCLCIIVMMIMSCAYIPSYAASTSTITAAGVTVIEAENFSDCYDPSTGTVLVIGGVPSYISYNAGEWMEYNIKVSKDSVYTISACAGVVTPVPIIFSVDGEDVLSTEFPATAGFADMRENAVGTIELTKGTHTLRISNGGGGCEFDYFAFERYIDESTLPDVSKTTGSYRSHHLPTIIQAEDFDLGTDGAKAADGKENSKIYRKDTAITIDGNKDTAYTVSLREGEWVKYSFIADKSAVYAMSIAAGSTGEAEVYFDNRIAPVTAKFEGNDKYPENKVTSIYLEAGEHFVTVHPKNSSVSYDYLRFGVDDTQEFITLDSLNTIPETEEKEEKVNPIYKELYVSETGDDSADGEKDAPFKTLRRAKEEVAKINADMQGDIIINILPGYYKLEETEVFSVEHSGKNGFNVIFRGTDPENPPVISGGNQVTGWEKHTEQIWKAPITGAEEVRNLYVNDFPAVRARSKYTYANMELYNDPATPYRNDGFYVSKQNFPEHFEKPSEIELVWSLEWVGQRTPLESVMRDDEEKVLLLMSQPCFDRAAVNPDTDIISTNVGKRFYIENAYELLDEPGEFYYDKDEKTVYYYPYYADDMKTAKTFIGDVEGMIKVSGNSKDEKIANLVFDNLSFKYGAWNAPSEQGYIANQADSSYDMSPDATMGDRTLIPAQFAIERAENIKVINSEFKCLGSSAISMVDAVSKAEVVGNVFTDISAMGVSIGTPKHEKIADDMEMCKNIDVKNNVFWRVAGEYRNSLAVGVYYEKSVNIVHNDIRYLPYSAITAGWGWGAPGPEGWGNYKISRNYIEDCMSSLRDGSHIYTLGPQPGSEISYNYITKSGYVLSGVYTDSGSAYIQIHHNVIDSEPGTQWWYQGHLATHNMRAYHNFTGSEIYRDAQTGNVVEDTILIENGELPNEAQKIKDEAGLEPEYRRLLEKAQKPSGKNCRLENFPLTAFVSRANGWIEAEDFNKGGEGVGYHKITPLPGNNAYRPDGVGLWPAPTYSGYCVDRDFPGEWLAYDFTVPESGTYYVDFELCNAWDSNVKPATNIYIDDELVLENIELAKSADWEYPVLSKIGAFETTAGKHTLKMEFLVNGFYFDRLRVHDGSAYEEISDGAEEETVSFENAPDYDEGVLVIEPLPEKEIGFVDVDGHWAEEVIIKMTKEGLIKGVDETHFAPNDFVTKGQAILLSMRVLNLEHSEETYIEDAINYGILKDATDINNAVIREEFIDIVMKAYVSKNKKYKLTVEETPFADVAEINNEYLSHILGAKELKLIVGDENGNFNPKNNLTRAEATTVIERLS